MIVAAPLEAVFAKPGAPARETCGSFSPSEEPLDKSPMRPGRSLGVGENGIAKLS